ncbi:O-methyltransferase [Diplocarpon mali]|nr:O-methyltransferase [Diplocarpon mali]
MASLVELASQVQSAAEAVSSGQANDNMALLAAIRNLNRVAESPSDRLRRVVYQTVQNSALRLAVEMGLPKALAEDNDITAAELATRSGADHSLVVRVMRVLIAMDIVDETGEEQYRCNPSTQCLASPTWTGAVRFLHDTLSPSFAKLVDYYHSTGFNIKDKTLFEYALGSDFWTYHRERPILHNDFLVYMKGRRDGLPRWLDYFPVAAQVSDLSTSPDAVTLVDIGGNLGHDLKLFQQRCPQIPGRLVLMDLPEVLAGNPDPLEGIEKIAYDFFEPQRIIGAKFYMFRAICHDWPDADCIRFLGNTVRAMKKRYSRILINDQVLPNTGAGLHPAVLDLTMMTYFHAMERTERQWRRMLDAVGVDIVRIWRFEGGGTEAVIEAQIRE